MLKNLPNLLLTIVVAACLLGGGGVAYGLSNLVVQLIAFAVLAFNGDVIWGFVTKAPKGLVALVIATIALPAIQLVPLPPAVWTTLPGRELVSEAVNMFGAPGWRAVTVNSARTLVALIGLVVPVTIVAAGVFLSEDARQRIAVAYVALGVASVLLGAFQVMGTNQVGLLYPENPLPGVLFGFFANRNSVAVFLVSCLLLLVCCFPPQRLLSPRWTVQFLSGVLMVVAVVLTQSRTGITLLSLPFSLALLRTFSQRSQAKRPGQEQDLSFGRMGRVGIILAAAAALGLASVAAIPGSRLDTVIARFEEDTQRRPEIWENARYSAERFWPAGAGMGNFDEVYQVDESLEHISIRRAGRAHNEILELAIEAGPFGLILLAAWCIWALSAGWAAMQDERRRWQALAGGGILLASALQSLLDFPLRNQTMLCMAAFAVILLAPPVRFAQTPAHNEGATA
ncbi:MAG: hypothetical protein B7X90_09195 [Novosphingobium sp. 17-62-19]|nr:MAG: hypothetical protein B7Y74_03255 [Novosphingobium sp. 35-62-5]OZA19299.1 MAG: hypothetical protein B7X90_09195 [Novosphingobium sp. 17-62-19]HQS95368.1 O-antigen ligase family protein [Novosphingobium sp.]